MRLTPFFLLIALLLLPIVFPELDSFWSSKVYDPPAGGMENEE